MAEMSLLKPLDAASLEAMCEVFARMRYAVREREIRGLLSHNASGGEVVAPWVRIEAEATRDFRGWCAEYGLTPAAEKNLRSADDDKGQPDNPFQ
jgi:P27 family predicted phage terminase small subunit